MTMCSTFSTRHQQEIFRGRDFRAKKFPRAGAKTANIFALRKFPAIQCTPKVVLLPYSSEKQYSLSLSDVVTFIVIWDSAYCIKMS